MNPKVKKLKTFTLDEVKDRFIGQPGTPERAQYEHELRIEVIGAMIKKARQERQLTQEELGRLIGVQKAQISKLENNTNSTTIGTLLRVFQALQAEIHFTVTLDNKFLRME